MILAELQPCARAPYLPEPGLEADWAKEYRVSLSQAAAPASMHKPAWDRLGWGTEMALLDQVSVSISIGHAEDQHCGPHQDQAIAITGTCKSQSSKWVWARRPRGPPQMTSLQKLMHTKTKAKVRMDRAVKWACTSGLNRLATAPAIACKPELLAGWAAGPRKPVFWTSPEKVPASPAITGYYQHA